MVKNDITLCQCHQMPILNGQFTHSVAKILRQRERATMARSIKVSRGTEGHLILRDGWTTKEREKMLGSGTKKMGLISFVRAL